MLENKDNDSLSCILSEIDYAFMDKATRTSTIAYKNQGSQLLKVLHMKCASVDEHRSESVV